MQTSDPSSIIKNPSFLIWTKT